MFTLHFPQRFLEGGNQKIKKLTYDFCVYFVNRDCWYVNEYRQLHDIRPKTYSKQEEITGDQLLSSY